MATIRKAGLKDYTDVKSMMLTALKEDPHAFSVSFEEYQPNTEFWWMGYINPFLYNNSQEMFLAYEDKKFAGMIGITYDNKERKKHIGSFVWFYVKKEFRGKGIGKKLLEEALAKLDKNLSIQKIALLVVETQESAIELYKKFGFEINGTLKKELKFGPEFFNVLVMEKVN